MVMFERSIVVSQEREFAERIATSITEDIYKGFVLPTRFVYGSISLKNPSQYSVLDKLVRTATSRGGVTSLRIFGPEAVVAYSLVQEESGRSDLAGPDTAAVYNGGAPSFVVEGGETLLAALFRTSFEPGTFVLRGTQPLRIPAGERSTDAGSVIGVLEFTRDITPTVERVARLQRWLALGIVAMLAGLGVGVFLHVRGRNDTAG